MCSARSTKVADHQNITLDGLTWFNECSRTFTDAWSEQAQSINEHHRNYNKKKKRKRLGGYFSCCSCSPLCALVSLLGVFLIGATIAGIVVGILVTRKIATSKSTLTSTMSTGSTTETTTSSTSRTSSTTTTTTTTSYVCGFACLNQTWISSLNLLAKWSFDGTLFDQTNAFNTSSTSNLSFVTNGYVKNAVAFNSTANQLLTTSYIPLANTSFTVEVWLYPTGFANYLDQSIFSLCLSTSAHQCLHLTMRKSGSSFYLYMGFYADDLQGATPLVLNKWIHAAFVFELTTLNQSIYFNGILDSSRKASAPFLANTGNVTIGDTPGINPTSGNNYFQGYMDQLTINNRAKPWCEVLDDATLAAQFTFESGPPFFDSGPNLLSAITQSISVVSTGHSVQAISFDGSSSSYFQISDLTGIGINDKAFSISLWIRPVNLSGTLVHASSNVSGLGWCLPFIGFATNGSLVAQMYNSAPISVLGPIISTSSVWSHVVETWSSTNGLRLYVDNVLAAFRLVSATSYTASSVPDYITLGNSIGGNGTCPSGLIDTLSSFMGDVDDFRIYSRELTAADVCVLY